MRLGYLDTIRSVAIVFVIAIHAVSYVGPLHGALANTLEYLVFPVAVALFFLVDGYLASLRLNDQESRTLKFNTKRQVYRLLLPWLFFTLAYTGFRLVAELMGIVSQNILAVNSMLQLTQKMLGGEYAMQLYFLPSLFLIRLFFSGVSKVLPLSNLFILIAGCTYPLFYWLLKEDLKFFNLTSYGLDPVEHAFWGVNLYLAGMVLGSIREKQMPLVFILCLLTILWINFFPNPEVYLIQPLIYQIALSICIFSMLKVVPDFKVSTLIGRNTMGIYLLHQPVIIFLLISVLSAMRLTNSTLFVVTVFSTLILSFILSILLQQVKVGRAIQGISTGT